ncbi:hypothetical protein [Lactonifactor longoviformis]|uniref:hypothetical protein n=1 Tax=Lactonifactor longoviformis TaxID=341220 RepID=UPI0036F42E81
MKLKLYKVTYKVWNSTFSDLLQREELSIGVHGEDAVRRIREKADKDARDFNAWEITEVLGRSIIVE